jgi:nucleoside phosphorylase
MELREIKGRVDFAIITIREDELKAVLKRFPGETVESHNRFYRVSKVPVGDGSTVLVAIARAFEQGTGEAQTIARHIIDDLDPHWILVVGIAGGVPDSEHTLGDVVLSTRVNDLTVHAHQEAAPTQYALSGGPSTHSVTKLITALPMLESRFEGWNTQDSIGKQRPVVDLSKPESFYGDEEWQKKVRDSLNHHFGSSVVPREPLVRAGPIDSSDGLIKDTKALQHWLTLTRDAVAVEMEAAGVYRAVRSGGREYSFLSIRGLSDIVGFKRHPDWTAYACHSAAAFTHALIKSGLVKRREEVPTPQPYSASVHPREGNERHWQGDELLARVRLFADLKETHDGWGVRIEERRARPPLGEYLHVAKSKGPLRIAYPLAAAAQLTPEVLDVFLADAHERYRIGDPHVLSTLVYEGNAPDAALAARAHDSGLLLQSITEYMGVPNFSGYLREQSRQLESAGAYQSQFYIEQRAVITVEGRDTSTEDALAQVQQWMNQRLGHLVLVLGDFGTGKTFLLRELALRMARAGSQSPIPLFIELRRLEKKPTLDELIASQLAHAKMNTIPVEAIRVMLGDGRIALLFDGFDEYVQRVTYPRAAEHLSTLIQVASDKTKIVITSRTQHFESEHQVREALTKGSGSPRGYQLMRLQPFTRERIHQFLARRLGDPIEAAKRSLLLDELPDLPSLAVNPRMLSFIMDLPEEDLRKAKERHQSMTRAGLYELLLDRWLQGETLRVGPGLSTKQRWGAVTELAMKLWLTGEPAIFLDQLSNEFVEPIQKLEERRLETGEAEHQIGSGTLLVRDEQKKFSFIHQSVMEWLVAKKIAGSIQQGAPVPELASQTLSGLMVEFLCELAGGKQVEQWAQTTLDAGADATLHKNVLALLGKLGVEPRARKSRAGQDLRGEDFSGKDLSNLDFSRADFTGVSLVRAKLAGARLVGARFQRADLSGANLERADLSGADLSGARLLEASLLGATLRGTRFHQAKLLKARFDSGVLEGRKDDLWGAAHSQSGSPVPSVSASSYCYSAAYSPDGQLLAAGCGCSLQLWDMESGSLLRVLQGHEGLVSCVAFAPDGKTLASGSLDSTVRLWDADKGTERRVLKGHAQRVLSVAFAPDGKTLASGS